MSMSIGETKATGMSKSMVVVGVLGVGAVLGGVLYLKKQRALYRANKEATLLHAWWKHGYKKPFERDTHLDTLRREAKTVRQDVKSEGRGTFVCESDEMFRDEGLEPYMRRMARNHFRGTVNHVFDGVRCEHVTASVGRERPSDRLPGSWLTEADIQRFCELYTRFLEANAADNGANGNERAHAYWNVERLLWSWRNATAERSVIVAETCVAVGGMTSLYVGAKAVGLM
jgi:hypothetical protein